MNNIYIYPNTDSRDRSKEYLCVCVCVRDFGVPFGSGELYSTRSNVERQSPSIGLCQPWFDIPSPEHLIEKLKFSDTNHNNCRTWEISSMSHFVKRMLAPGLLCSKQHLCRSPEYITWDRYRQRRGVMCPEQLSI